MQSFTKVYDFIGNLQNHLDTILQKNFVGCYIHGSIALGGFNEKSSDVDLLVVTETSISNVVKRQLATLFLSLSNQPYPIEISFINYDQLKRWQHPCSYDFHYSEYWRDRFTEDLLHNTHVYINQENKIDNDLAAHISIIKHCGIVYKGKPIQEVFPTIPRADYIDSILTDFYDCLAAIDEQPTYCILNSLRVYLYVKQGIILSKQEAGKWGSANLPSPYNNVVRKALESYVSNSINLPYVTSELTGYKQFILKIIGL